MATRHPRDAQEPSARELAARFGVSPAAVSRWLSGQRSAPSSFGRFLRAVSAGDAAAAAEARAAYQPRRARQRPALRLEVVLPRGMTEEEAQETCTRAFVSLREGSL